MGRWVVVGMAGVEARLERLEGTTAALVGGWWEDQAARAADLAVAQLAAVELQVAGVEDRGCLGTALAQSHPRGTGELVR